MLTSLLQDSLRSFPPVDVYAGSRSGAKELSRFIIWTPQILWALLAAALLVGLLVGLRRKRGLWWLTALPYGMVLLVIWFQVELNGVSPFSPNAKYHSLAFFWEDAAPSLWALGLLAGLHVVLVLALSRRRDP